MVEDGSSGDLEVHFDAHSAYLPSPSFWPSNPPTYFYTCVAFQICIEVTSLELTLDLLVALRKTP